MALDEYHRKRVFEKTPEPAGREVVGENQWRFVVQKHDASRLHYDLRLELNGVLLSWAVPKGPSLDWNDKRLAVHVEDHPIEYLKFEGIIPKHEYGGGTVMVWDLGNWKPRYDAQQDYERGELKFDLFGEKLQGGWMLKRLNNRGENEWLLIKEKDSAMRNSDELNVLSAMPESVLTGRTLDEISADTTIVWSKSSKQQFQFDPTQFAKAKPAKLPTKLKPCLPTASRFAPQGEKWVHEIKHDGYRMLCHIHQETAEFYSRNGKNWTSRLRSLAHACSQLSVDNVVLDGEVVMLTEDGRTSFQELQNRIGAGRDAELRYYVFDILHLNGHTLTALSLLDRKRILEELMTAHGESTRLLFSEHMLGDGPTIFSQACKLGLEGIVSKRADKRYAQGRFEFWVKTKCLQSREFIIGGFTPPTSSRKGLGAILIGIPLDDGTLQFAGKIGTGFSHQALVDLRTSLEGLKSLKTPFANLDRRNADKGTVWVEPQVVAEIEFAGWTDDALIRFGTFRGIREDLDLTDLDSRLPNEDEGDLTTETMPSVPAFMGDVRPHESIEIPEELARIKLSSPGRLIYPDMGITKLGVAIYYAQIGKWMLPHIAGRPLSLFRCPGGLSQTCFFQKRPPQGLHESVERVQLSKGDEERVFLVVHDLVGLLSLVQFGVLEFHVSGARVDNFNRPDRLVIDLDPDEQLPFEETVKAALDIRGQLELAGLKSFLKTTGGKGLHLVVPVRRRLDWDDFKHFAKELAATLEQQEPRRFTTNPAKKARRGRILLDVLRNTHGATAVAVYSTRAKAKASVSVPIGWDEVTSLANSDGMSLQMVVDRLAAQQHDPWEYIRDVDQGITQQVRKRLLS